MYRVAISAESQTYSSYSQALYYAQRLALERRGQTVSVWDIPSGLKLKDLWWDREAERLQEMSY